MELISIIMPAYNAEEFIAATIDSVLKQTYTDWELLIINDGSTDNTRHIAEGYSSNDPRIKVINQQNKKQAAARNVGIKSSKGQWIAFLDADDLWAENKLSKQILASNNFPTAGVIYTDGWIFRDSDLKNLVPYATLTDKLIDFREMYNLEYYFNYVPNLAVLIKKSVINKIGFQDERSTFYGCEDWDYWLRAARVGCDFYGVPEKLFYYRKHNNSTSSNSVNMLLAKVSVLIKNYDAELVNKIEGTKQLKILVFHLINILIKEKRFVDINYILNAVLEILPLNSLKFIKKVIKILGKRSFIPVAIIGKLELLGI